MIKNTISTIKSWFSSSDYSGFSLFELENMYKYADDAFINLHCPNDARSKSSTVNAVCKYCSISADCNALLTVKNNIEAEIFERKSKGGFSW
jgi:hypothetical protein